MTTLPMTGKRKTGTTRRLSFRVRKKRRSAWLRKRRRKRPPSRNVTRRRRKRLRLRPNSRRRRRSRRRLRLKSRGPRKPRKRPPQPRKLLTLRALTKNLTKDLALILALILTLIPTATALSTPIARITARIAMTSVNVNTKSAWRRQRLRVWHASSWPRQSAVQASFVAQLYASWGTLIPVRRRYWITFDEPTSKMEKLAVLRSKLVRLSFPRSLSSSERRS
mmetsp:Transcript_401/g.1557  ORF Transcript_401/g.1557 Transcript_401/m.1557 type:complete len:222 (-) Transcript_401:1766-2431(-)